jgi:hypothetical protein
MSREYLRDLALEVGSSVVHHINGLAPHQRMQKTSGFLKPPPEMAAYPDVAGEELAIKHLRAAAEKLGHKIRIVGDPSSNSHHLDVGPETAECIWCYLDAVDGTLKLSGLGNTASCLRAVNDGSWAMGIAFTDPTTAAREELALGDFAVAAIVDGCPAPDAAYPKAVVAVKEQDNSRFVTSSIAGQQLYTSTNDRLKQTMVYFDSFQAFDANTAEPGDPQLAKQLYCQLIDRTQGGAFDVLRTYGNLSSLIRCMLGWREAADLWMEPQCAGFLALNENLANMVPCIPIMLGAGGVAVDFDGNKLESRKLKQGRGSVLYAANDVIAQALLQHVKDARSSCGLG